MTCLSRHTMNHATRTVQYSPITLLGSSGDAHTLCLYRQVIDNAEDGCRLAWAVCAYATTGGKSEESFLVEPGEIGLAPLEEAAHGIDQDAKGRLAQLAAGLAE
jgi:hypothetical protein